MKNFIGEFKQFVMRGNVIDMAVGVVVGTAFSAIVNSIVQDIVMPAVSLITGKIDFTNLFIALDGKEYATLQDAKGATSVIAYGSFIQAVVQFLIIAFSLFVVVKAMNRLRKPVADAAPTTKVCPYCKSEINIEATKCPFCASEQPLEAMDDEKSLDDPMHV